MSTLNPTTRCWICGRRKFPWDAVLPTRVAATDTVTSAHKRCQISVLREFARGVRLGTETGLDD